MNGTGSTVDRRIHCCVRERGEDGIKVDPRTVDHEMLKFVVAAVDNQMLDGLLYPADSFPIKCEVGLSVTNVSRPLSIHELKPRLHDGRRQALKCCPGTDCVQCDVNEALLAGEILRLCR